MMMPQAHDPQHDPHSWQSLAAQLLTYQRKEAAAALQAMEEPGTNVSGETFLATLLADTTYLRMTAAHFLGEMREFAPIEALFVALRDTSNPARITAAWALRKVGNRVPAEWWRPILADASPHLRVLALDALASQTSHSHLR